MYIFHFKKTTFLFELESLEWRGGQFIFSFNMGYPLWWLSLQWKKFFQVHVALFKKTFWHASIKRKDRIYYFIFYDDKNVLLDKMFDVEAHVWIINLQMDFMLDVKIMLMLCDISCQYYNIDGYQHFPHISSYLKHIKNHIMITLTRSDRKYWKIFIVWKVFHVSVSLLYDLSGVYFSPLRCLKIK